MQLDNRFAGFFRRLVLAGLWILLPASASADEQNGIVSLDLCTDWMLQHYAKTGQVKAYSPYLKSHPGPVETQNARSHDGSLEQIISLRPALVISGVYNAPLIRQRLRQLDYDVRILPHPESLDDVADYINYGKKDQGCRYDVSYVHNQVFGRS